MKDWWVKLIAAILGQVSGPLREAIMKSVGEWEIKAKETPNPWDDILVGIVKFFLAIP